MNERGECKTLGLNTVPKTPMGECGGLARSALSAEVGFDVVGVYARGELCSKYKVSARGAVSEPEAQ